ETGRDPSAEVSPPRKFRTALPMASDGPWLAFSAGVSRHSHLNAVDVCARLTVITIRDSTIAISDMRLGGKLRYLREVEGTLRGLGRAMTQQEIVRPIKKDLGKTISQTYLSQIESEGRPQLTNWTRMLLAMLFNA